LVLISHDITIDGKVNTCHESVEEVDEQNKKITFKLFGGDIDEHYKVFNLIIEVIDNGDGSGAAKWTVEYEKINEDIDPPNGWMDLLGKITREVDAHLVKGTNI
jgi:hypothetical protein